MLGIDTYTQSFNRAIGVLDSTSRSVHGLAAKFSGLSQELNKGQIAFDHFTSAAAKNRFIYDSFKNIPKDIHEARMAVERFNAQQDRLAASAKILELRMNLSFKTPLKAISTMGKEFSSLTQSMEKFGNSTQRIIGSFSNMLSSSGIKVEGMRSSLLQFNRSMFETIRVSETMGRSEVFSDQLWNRVRKNTNLSKVDFNNLYLTYMNMVKGLPMGRNEFINFAEVLKDKFGGGLDVAMDKMQKLIQIQQDMPDVMAEIGKLRQSSDKDQITSFLFQVGQKYGSQQRNLMAQMLENTGKGTDLYNEYVNSVAKANQAQMDFATNTAKSSESALVGINRLAESFLGLSDSVVNSSKTFPTILTYFSQLSMVAGGAGMAVGGIGHAAGGLSRLLGAFRTVAPAAATVAGTAAVGTAAAGTAATGTAAAGTAAAAAKFLPKFGIGKGGLVGLGLAATALAAYGGYKLWKGSRKTEEEGVTGPAAGQGSAVGSPNAAVAGLDAQIASTKTILGYSKSWAESTRSVADQLKEMGAVGAGIADFSNESYQATQMNVSLHSKLLRNLEDVLVLAQKNADSAKDEASQRNLAAAKEAVMAEKMEQRLAIQKAVEASIKRSTAENEAGATLIKRQRDLLSSQADYVEKLALGMAPSYTMRKRIWEATVAERREIEKSIISRKEALATEKLNTEFKDKQKRSLQDLGVTQEQINKMAMGDMGAYYQAKDTIDRNQKISDAERKSAAQELTQSYNDLVDRQKRIVDLKSQELEQTMKIREGYLDVINEMTTGSDLITRLLPNMERGAMSILDVGRMMKGADFGGAMRVGFASKTGFGPAGEAGMAPRYGKFGMEGSFNNPAPAAYRTWQDQQRGMTQPGWYAGLDMSRSNIGMMGFPSGGLGFGANGSPMNFGLPPRMSGGMLRAFGSGGLSGKSVVDLSATGGRISGVGGLGRDGAFANVGGETILIGGGEFAIPGRSIKGSKDYDLLHRANSMGGSVGSINPMTYNNSFNAASNSPLAFKLSGGFVVNQKATAVPGMAGALSSFVSGDSTKLQSLVMNQGGPLRMFNGGGGRILDTSGRPLTGDRLAASIRLREKLRPAVSSVGNVTLSPETSKLVSGFSKVAKPGVRFVAKNAAYAALAEQLSGVLTGAVAKDPVEAMSEIDKVFQKAKDKVSIIKKGREKRGSGDSVEEAFVNQLLNEWDMIPGRGIDAASALGGLFKITGIASAAGIKYGGVQLWRKMTGQKSVEEEAGEKKLIEMKVRYIQNRNQRLGINTEGKTETQLIPLERLIESRPGNFVGPSIGSDAWLTQMVRVSKLLTEEDFNKFFEAATSRRTVSSLVNTPEQKIAYSDKLQRDIDQTSASFKQQLADPTFDLYAASLPKQKKVENQYRSNFSQFDEQILRLKLDQPRKAENRRRKIEGERAMQNLLPSVSFINGGSIGSGLSGPQTSREMYPSGASLMLTGGINVDRLYLGGNLMGQKLRSDNSDFWKKLDMQVFG